MTFDDFRLAALALPRATEAPHHEAWSFRVDDRIFATVPPGETHVHLFVDEATIEAALERHPGVADVVRWGGRVVGLRVELRDMDAKPLTDLIEAAWKAKVRR